MKIGIDHALSQVWNALAIIKSMVKLIKMLAAAGIRKNGESLNKPRVTTTAITRSSKIAATR